MTENHDEQSNTLEREPDAAASVFGDRIDLARRFVADLAQFGEQLGLIGPLELPRLWTRHVVNSGLLAPLLQAGGLVGDIGSGAGLPGIPLAIARPDVELMLIEPMERRVDWLNDEIERLGLTNVTVQRARAEDAVLARQLDQATARAVSALSKLIPVVAPLVRSDGELLFMKGAKVADEVTAASKAIRRHHIVDVEILELGAEHGTEITRVFRATVE